jgi:hypothetical protein
MAPWQETLIATKRRNQPPPITDDGILALLRVSPEAALESVQHLLGLARQLASALTGGPSCPTDKVVHVLLEFALRVTGAEVASCRRIGNGEEVVLFSGAVHWARGVNAVGEVAARQHPEDCLTRLTVVQARIRTEENYKQVVSRCKHDAPDQPFYSPQQLEHFAWLGSEALVPLLVTDGVPRFIVVLGHSDPHHLVKPGPLDLLEFSRGFLEVLFELSELAEEEVAKDRLLGNIAHVLPKIASAETDVAFARAVCALLSCHEGFKFNHVLYFEMPNGQLPAECAMALGGIELMWSQGFAQISAELPTLTDYIDDALARPLPVAEDGMPLDPLYEEVCGTDRRLMYLEGASPRLDEFLQTGMGGGGPALKLTGDDPWIRRVHRESHGRVFRNPHDEFFVFLLRPYDAPDGEGPLGFVVADLAYQPHRHHPGPGFPNLPLAAFTLQLIAGLRRFRNDAASYFHVLRALPTLRHEGHQLAGLVFDVVQTLPIGLLKHADTKESLTRLRAAAEEISKAQAIISGLDSLKRPSSQCTDLRDCIKAYVARAAQRHSSQLVCEISPHSPAVMVDIHPDALNVVLACLLDNAVKHGGPHGTQVTCQLDWTIPDVPVGGGRMHKRVLLRLSNDGSPIDPHLMPFLFAKTVSTAQSEGHGSGLSSARALAEQFGGDVVVTGCNPVEFQVILRPSAVVSLGGDYKRGPPCGAH